MKCVLYERIPSWMQSVHRPPHSCGSLAGAAKAQRLQNAAAAGNGVRALELAQLRLCGTIQRASGKEGGRGGGG